MAPANSRAKKVQAAVIVSAKIKAIIDGVEAIQAKLVNFQAQSEAAHSEATQSSLADIKATVDELQTKARDVSSQMDFMAATLKHSEPISNTDVSDPFASMLPRRCPNSTMPCPPPPNPAPLHPMAFSTALR